MSTYVNVNLSCKFSRFKDTWRSSNCSPWNCDAWI